MDRQVKIVDLNPLLQCKLCQGYLVQPTTVVECLHTFCKSCIVKYLKSHNDCPQCKRFLHYSYPLNFIAQDRTMQIIMDKLMPEVHASVAAQKQLFYLNRNKLTNTASTATTTTTTTSSETTSAINSAAASSASSCVDVIVEQPQQQPQQQQLTVSDDVMLHSQQNGS